MSQPIRAAEEIVESSPLRRTPLYNLNVELDGKMVPFAGYEMPVQFPAGIIKEHLHTRNAAGLFDISHMGQITIEGSTDVLAQLEKLMPGDFQELSPGQIRYSFLLNEQGGVLDDLMVTRPAAASEQNTAFVVVNAACKDADYALIKSALPNLKITLLEDRALLALQGPTAAKALSSFCNAPEQLKFMTAGKFNIADIGECWISRSGYTGEDGFEISAPNKAVETFARALLKLPDVMPIGLGARDSLRLEAGLCLYGHELDPATTPIEAGLTWAIGKRRRQQGGFAGAAKLQKQFAEGVTRKRVAIKPEGRVLARENTEIFDMNEQKIGIITSGGFGPSANGPVCLGYVTTANAKPGTQVQLQIRGKFFPATVTSLPFVSHNYLRS